jgi:glutamate dehydrogenase
MVGVDTLVEEIARWYLLNEPAAPIRGTIEAGASSFAELSGVLERSGSEAWRTERLAAARLLEERGVPAEVARRHIFQPELVHGPNIMAVAKVFARPLEDVANAFFLAGERLQLDWLERRLAELPQQSRWQRWGSQAIRDDLLGLRRDAAMRVLAREDAVTVESQLTRFLDERKGALERLGRLVSTLAAQEEASLAGLTIAVRQARRVVA